MVTSQHRFAEVQHISMPLSGVGITRSICLRRIWLLQKSSNIFIIIFMKTYILAPGSYGEKVADTMSISKDGRIYTFREWEESGKDGNILIAEKVAQDPNGALWIIPVHNLHGMVVGKAVAAIIQQGNAVTIVGDHLLPISHVLAAKTGWKIPEIIYSHEQALKQCVGALKSRYAASQLQQNNATSGCIDTLWENDAVICAREAAIKRGLIIIDDTINPPNNETLFVVIATTSKLDALIPQVPMTENKTSLVNITLPDRDGSFVEILNRLNQGIGGGPSSLRWFSQLESHVKTGGTMHDVHFVYRNLDESKVTDREWIQFVPRWHRTSN